jgi:hypothetical protein
MLDVGAPTIAQNVEAPTFVLATSSRIPNRFQKNIRLAKICSTWNGSRSNVRVIRMRKSFEQSEHSNEVVGRPTNDAGEFSSMWGEKE